MRIDCVWTAKLNTVIWSYSMNVKAIVELLVDKINEVATDKQKLWWDTFGKCQGRLNYRVVPCNRHFVRKELSLERAFSRLKCNSRHHRTSSDVTNLLVTKIEIPTENRHSLNDHDSLSHESTISWREKPAWHEIGSHDYVCCLPCLRISLWVGDISVTEKVMDVKFSTVWLITWKVKCRCQWWSQWNSAVQYSHEHDWLAGLAFIFESFGSLFDLAKSEVPFEEGWRPVGTWGVWTIIK